MTTSDVTQDDERQIATLRAAEDRIDVSADVWSSLLSLAAACTPGLADECVVELTQSGAQLRRATVVGGGAVTADISVDVTADERGPLPSTRKLMLSRAPELTTPEMVAVLMTSDTDEEPYVAVVTCRGLTRASADVRDMLLALARWTAGGISRAQLGQALAGERERSANLQIALATNREIGMAMGIVMERLGCTADDAFTRLRRASQDANRKLRDIAAEVVLTGAVPRLVVDQPLQLVTDMVIPTGGRSEGR